MKNEIRVIANLPIKGQDIIKRVYDARGIAPTLSTMQGGRREPKVLVQAGIIHCVDIPKKDMYFS